MVIYKEKVQKLVKFAGYFEKKKRATYIAVVLRALAGNSVILMVVYCHGKHGF